MPLLWKDAPVIWRAKGYNHTTAADALEAEFGTRKKLGRTSISILVKTQCEPCPPEVERFIRDMLPVLDQESWPCISPGWPRGRPRRTPRPSR